MCEHFIINYNLYIFVQFLSALVRRIGPFENLCKVWMSQVISGVNHLHKQKIAHRDLKLRNILIGEKNHLYIFDFGLSRIALRERKSVLLSQTLWYSSLYGTRNFDTT